MPPDQEPTSASLVHSVGNHDQTIDSASVPRRDEFSGNQLIVNPSNPDEHRRVAWEH